MRTIDLFRDVSRIFGRGFPLIYIASLNETAGSKTTAHFAKCGAKRFRPPEPSEIYNFDRKFA